MRDKVGKSAKLKSIIDPNKRNMDLFALAQEWKVVYEEPETTSVEDASIDASVATSEDAEVATEE